MLRCKKKALGNCYLNCKYTLYSLNNSHTPTLVLSVYWDCYSRLIMIISFDSKPLFGVSWSVYLLALTLVETILVPILGRTWSQQYKKWFYLLRMFPDVDWLMSPCLELVPHLNSLESFGKNSLLCESQHCTILTNSYHPQHTVGHSPH